MLFRSNVYEIKCVDNIIIEHKIQLLVYKWLWKHNNMNSIYGNKTFILLNVKTGETLKLNENDYNMEEIMKLLFINKFNKTNVVNDVDFINNIHYYEKKYYNI